MNHKVGQTEFGKLFRQMTDEFLEILKEKYSNIDIYGYLIHEMSYLARLFKEEREDFSDTDKIAFPDYENQNDFKLKEFIIAMECIIQAVHDFIDTGELNRFTTFYSGSNYRKDENGKPDRWSTYEWSKEKQCFVRVIK